MFPASSRLLQALMLLLLLLLLLAVAVVEAPVAVAVVAAILPSASAPPLQEQRRGEEEPSVSLTYAMRDSGPQGSNGPLDTLDTTALDPEAKRLGLGPGPLLTPVSILVLVWTTGTW